MINKVIDTASHSLISIGDIQAVEGMILNTDVIKNNLSTEGFLHFRHTRGNVDNVINTLNCLTSLAFRYTRGDTGSVLNNIISESLVTYFSLHNSILNTTHLISSKAQTNVLYLDHTSTSAENNLISEGVINSLENVHYPYRILQGLYAFFKTNKTRYPYFVMGYFNNQIVFGSSNSIILKGIYERLKSEVNLVCIKEMFVARNIHSVSSRSDMLHHIKSMSLSNITYTLKSINNVATYYKLKYIEPFLQEVNSDANTAYVHKSINLEKIMFVFESNTLISFFHTGGVPKENLELLSIADVLAITKHENINDTIVSLVTHGQSDIRYGKILYISRLETIETSNNISLYVVQGVPNIVESLNTFVELTFVVGENYHVDTTEHLLTSFGDLSTGYQEALYIDEHVDIVDTVYVQQLFYIGPYNAELLIKSVADLMYYIKEAHSHTETDIINSYANTATKVHHAIEGMDVLFSAGDLQTEPIWYTEFLRDIVNSIGDTEYYLKYEETSAEETFVSDGDLSFVVGLKVLIEAILSTVESNINISYFTTQAMLADTNSASSQGNIVTVQGQNKTISALLESLNTSNNFSYIVAHLIEGNHSLSTQFNLEMFYKYVNVPQETNSLITHAQSDYVIGEDRFTSRTEELKTRAETVVINNPGYLPESLLIESDNNIYTIVGDNMSTGTQQHYLSTFAYLDFAKDLVINTQYDIVSQGNLYYILDTPTEVITNVLVSEAPLSNFTFFLDNSLSNLLNTSNTQAGILHEAVAPVTITLNKSSGTGGTSSITSIAGFSITPTSVTMPTRSIYNFKGYFESSFASDRQEVKLTGPSSGTNRRFTFEDNNANGVPTMFLENLYNDSTLWRFHAAVKSTHAITHFDISDQTISAEQVSSNTSYTYIIDTPITSNMANYAYKGVHYEFLDIVTNSTATVSIIDTFVYISPTKIVQKIDSTGNYLNLLNDTYTANKTLYAFWADDKVKVIWKNYAGTILKTEWVSYTVYSSVVPNISYAPTGTSNTSQYTYAWPTASHSITSDIISGTSVTYTETRTTNQYTITWKAYNGVVLKTETINYGSTSTAPTGTSNTAQYTYAWPKASTTVTANETITETRVVNQYTIVWKSYSGAVLKTETINYGTVSTAPTGTANTLEYTYAWPKASVTVTANETITETRTLIVYTIIFKNYAGATVSTQNLNYNQTPTIPTGTTNTVQYTYTWPTVNKASANVTYTEIRTTNQYTVTWKNYAGSVVKTDTINYGSISTAPIGTLDTPEWDYSWPKTNVTVTGNETIIEIRGAQKYTLTFNANSGTNLSMTHKLVTFNEAYGALATVSKTNEQFLGWYRHFDSHEQYNLLGHWPLLKDLKDSTTNNRTLINTNTNVISQQTTGQLGGSVVTNNVAYTGALETADAFLVPESFSITVWVKVTGVTSSDFGGVVSFHNHSLNAGSGITVVKVAEENFVMSFNTGSGSSRTYKTYKGTTNIYNRWSHLALTYDKTSKMFRAYVDGVLDIEQSYDQLNVASKFAIFSWSTGYNNSSNYRLQGEIADVRLYEGALIADEVKEISRANILHYPLIDASANESKVIADYSRFNNHGTAAANSTFELNPITNTQAIKGTITTNKLFFENHNQVWTVMAWVKTSSKSSVYLNNFNLGNRVIHSTSSNKALLYLNSGTNDSYTYSAGAVPLDEWFHIAFVHNTSTLKCEIYINGVFSAKATNYTASDLEAGFAASTIFGQNLDGYTDVKVFAKDLSAADIKEIYAEQNKILPTTIVRETKDHTVYAHWNPTIVKDTQTDVVTSHGQSDTAFGGNRTTSKLEELASDAGLDYINQTVFNITLDKQSGTGGTNNITGMNGESISPTSVTVPTRTNYTFGGYYTATNGGGTQRINASGTYVALNSNTYVGNATLYAKWTMVDKTFSWTANPSIVGLKANVYIGGVSKGTNVTSHSASYPANSVFKVSGLTIPAGWQYSSYSTTSLTSVTTGGSGATTEVQGTGDMTSTATRSITTTIVGISYSISVTTNGGSGTKASVSTYTPKTSATTVTLTRGTRTNYRFLSWTVSGANGKATLSGNTLTIPAYTTSVQPYGNLSITANWGTAIASGTNTMASSADIDYETVAPITITLNKQSGTGGTNSIISVKGFYTDPTSVTVPTRSGYTFGGYYTSTNGGGTQRINASGTYVALTHSTYTSNATLYAQWTPITYTITRTLGTGVTAATISPTSYNVETENFTPTISGVAYSAGYGSYTVSPALTQITKGSTGNKSYTLTANKLNYTITMDANGGTGGTNPSSYQISTSAQTRSFTLPTRAGYTLSSWTVTGHTGTTPTVSSSTLTIPANAYGNLTIKANWTPTTYTLTKGSIPTGVATFVVNRTLSPIGDGSTGILNDGASIYYNDALTLSATASNGYNAPTRSPGNFVTVTGNTTVSVTAGSAITYTITADRNGGTGGYASATYVVIDSETLTTLLGTPTRTGYTLSSWKATTTSAGGWTKNTTYAPSTSVLNKYANVTLQAQWTGKSLTITLDKQGGTGGTSSIAVVYGTSLSPTSVTVPTRSGYTFGGYYTSTKGGGTQRINASGTYVALTNTTYTTNRTLYAKWVQDGYMLVWKYDKQADNSYCTYIGYNPLGLECSTLNSTQAIPGIEIGKTDICSVVVCRRKTASWSFLYTTSSDEQHDSYFETNISADAYQGLLFLTYEHPADQFPVGHTASVYDSSSGEYYIFEAI